MSALLPIARQLDWRCGVRLNTPSEFDPENPKFPTQFGFAPSEAVAAMKKIQRARARLETVSFHLRTNVASAGIYQQAIAEVAGICHLAKFAPRFLDLGVARPCATS